MYQLVLPCVAAREQAVWILVAFSTCGWPITLARDVHNTTASSGGVREALVLCDACTHRRFKPNKPC